MGLMTCYLDGSRRHAPSPETGTSGRPTPCDDLSAGSSLGDRLVSDRPPPAVDVDALRVAFAPHGGGDALVQADRGLDVALVAVAGDEAAPIASCHVADIAAEHQGLESLVALGEPDGPAFRK